MHFHYISISPQQYVCRTAWWWNYAATVKINYYAVSGAFIDSWHVMRVNAGKNSSVVTAITVTLIAWRAWPVLERSLLNSSRANTPLETPLAWVQTPWMLGWAWFAFTAWALLALALWALLRGDGDTARRAAGLGDETA